MLHISVRVFSLQLYESKTELVGVGGGQFCQLTTLFLQPIYCSMASL